MENESEMARRQREACGFISQEELARRQEAAYHLHKTEAMLTAIKRGEIRLKSPEDIMAEEIDRYERYDILWRIGGALIGLAVATLITLCVCQYRYIQTLEWALSVKLR